MKIEKKKERYLITVSHDELLAIVNGLGARQLLIREIGTIINPGDKKRGQELAKLHQGLAAALPPDVWDKKEPGEPVPR